MLLDYTRGACGAEDKHFYIVRQAVLRLEKSMQRDFERFRLRYRVPLRGTRYRRRNLSKTFKKHQKSHITNVIQSFVNLSTYEQKTRLGTALHPQTNLSTASILKICSKFHFILDQVVAPFFIRKTTFILTPFLRSKINL